MRGFAVGDRSTAGELSVGVRRPVGKGQETTHQQNGFRRGHINGEQMENSSQEPDLKFRMITKGELELWILSDYFFQRTLFAHFSWRKLLYILRKLSQNLVDF